jgi:glycosyltransferase involved in cell wall biosynthesis
MAESTPIVSVMMPVLGPHPVYFREAVKSVLSQTLRELELVIVEDPSESSARELLAGIDDPRVRLISNPTRTSLVDQRNRALAEARGEFVAMLDADDVARSDRLQFQLEFLRAHPHIGVLGSNLIIIDSTGAEIGTRNYPQDHDAIVAAMARYNAIAQPSVMCRRDVLVAAGGYQYREFPVNEDYELWSRLITRGVRLANHRSPLLRYRIHPGGTKALMLHHMLRATLDIKQRFWRDRMDVSARLRFWGEHALLGLPAAWVLKLFVMTQYLAGERSA